MGAYWLSASAKCSCLWIDRPQIFRNGRESSTVVLTTQGHSYSPQTGTGTTEDGWGANLDQARRGHLNAHNPERLLDEALAALSSESDWQPILDELPVPIYTADVDGQVTYWNRACVEIAGRVPELGQDRWCVTWRIYTTDGDFMPHDQCPMAEAIRTGEQNRGKVAIALRPDGTRVAFRPYPTPLFDSQGKLTGAINMLVDISDEQAEALSAQAEKCRRLADATYNREMAEILGSMAEGYDRTAAELCGKSA
jgi:PAS domain S-box-containing protein